MDQSHTSLVILSAPYDKVGEQVQKIRMMWPETHLALMAQPELEAAGANVVLPKEFSPEQLWEAVVEWELMARAHM